MISIAIRDIIPIRAGKFLFKEYDNDGVLGPTPKFYNVVVDTIATNFATTSQKVNDGNSTWPAGSFETEMEPQVTITLNSFHPQLLSDLIGGTYGSGSEDLWEIGEDHSVPSASPYTAILNHSYKVSGGVVLTGSDSSPWVKTETTPTTKQYQISGSIATFCSADAGAEIFVCYEHTEASTEHLEVPKDVAPKTVQLAIHGKAKNSDATGAEKDMNVIFDKAKFTGTFKIPDLSKTPGNWQLVFTVLKPRAGYKPCDIKVK